MNRIADNFSQIIDRIHDFERKNNRLSGTVTLLAVSKKQPIEKILQALDAGQKNFGENYLQEAEAKIEQLAEYPLTWHFIGPIQSNKTRAIANLFQWVQSVDRLKIARRLSEQRDSKLPPLNICVQVNAAGEATKSGVSLDDVELLCKQIAALPNLQLRGLMAIPVPKKDLSDQRQQFQILYAKFNALAPQFPQFDTLSMGMSNDYEAAIAEGSTMIRLGTALFGARI